MAPRSKSPRPHLDEERRGPLAWAGFGLLALATFVVAGVIFLLAFPPSNLIRERVIAEVKQRTGRDLAIAGETRLSFVPSLGVILNDITLSAPPRMEGPPLIKADGLDVRVALLPLILREVSVEQLVLRRPVVELRVDLDGRRSWDFAANASAPAAPVRYAQASPRGPDGRPLPKELQDFVRNSGDRPTDRGTFRGLNGISLADVLVADGTLRYADARSGQRQELTDINVQVSLPEFAGPLTIAGQLKHAGENVRVDTRLGSLKDALEERQTALALKISGKPLEAAYDGAFTGGPATALDGGLNLKAPSLATLARLLQVPLVGADGLGAVAFDGRIKLSSGTATVTANSFALGESTASGSVTVETHGARPLIKANVKIAALDLNRLQGIERAPAAAARFAPPAAPAAAPASTPAGRSGAAHSIEDLLNRSDDAPQSTPPAAAPGTAVRGFTRRSSDGWSSEAIDSNALRLVDIEARLDIGSLAVAQYRIGASTSAVQLKAGVLKIDVTEAQIYGGRAKGLVNVDARDPTLTIGANLSGDGIAIETLTKDAAEFDAIDGRGRLIVAVSARGGSERELVGTLAGRADIQLADGSVHGWDVNQIVAGLGQGRLPKLDRQPGAKTPFKALTGSFQIANGVARNQDLKLESSSLNAAGSGVVNIVDRNINFVLRPKLAGVSGVELPLRIAGPWDSPTVVADVAGALKSPQAQEAVKKLKDGDVEGAVRGVLGNDPKADQKIGKAKEFLRQFLNKQ